MGPDISLARTLISAVRLSGKVGGWAAGKGAKARKWAAGGTCRGTAQCGAYCKLASVPGESARLGRNMSGGRQKGGGARSRAVPLGCMNQLLIGSPIPSHALLSHAQAHTHTHSRSRQHQRQPPHVTTSDASTWAFSFIWAGCRGRILSLRIRTTANLASAVDPSSSHLQQFQTGKGPQTIPLPTSHD